MRKMVKSNLKFISKLVQSIILLNLNLIYSTNQSCEEEFGKNISINSIDIYKFSSNVDLFLIFYDYLIVASTPYIYLLKDDDKFGLKNPNYVLKNCIEVTPFDKKVLTPLNIPALPFLEFLICDVNKNCNILLINNSDYLLIDNKYEIKYNLSYDLSFCSIVNLDLEQKDTNSFEYFLLCQPLNSNGTLLSKLTAIPADRYLEIYHFSDEKRDAILSIDKIFLNNSQIHLVDVFFENKYPYYFLYLLTRQFIDDQIVTKLGRISTICYQSPWITDFTFESYTEIPLKCKFNNESESYNYATNLFINPSTLFEFKNESIFREKSILYVSFNSYDKKLNKIDESKGTLICGFEKEKLDKFFNDRTKECFHGNSENVSLMTHFYFDCFHNQIDKCIAIEVEDENFLCERKGDTNSFIESKIDFNGYLIHKFDKEIVTSLLEIEKREVMTYTNITLLYVGTKEGNLYQFIGDNEKKNFKKNEQFQLKMNQSIDSHRISIQKVGMDRRKNEFLISGQYLLGYSSIRRNIEDSKCQNRITFQKNEMIDKINFSSKIKSSLFMDQYLIVLTSDCIYLFKELEIQINKLILIDSRSLNQKINFSLITQLENDRMTKNISVCYEFQNEYESKCLIYYIENDMLIQGIKFYDFPSKLETISTMPLSKEIGKYLFTKDLYLESHFDSKFNFRLLSYVRFDSNISMFQAGNSSVFLRNEHYDKFKIHFIYAFEAEEHKDDYHYQFAYILKIERKSNQSNWSTKLVRVCSSNGDLDGYVEINLDCGKDFVRAQTASFINPYLYITFNNEKTHNESMDTNICYFELKKLQSIFNKGMIECHEGESENTTLINEFTNKEIWKEINKKTNKCIATWHVEPFCEASDDNPYIEYKLITQGKSIYKFKNEIIKSLVSKRMNGKDILIMISYNDQIYKLKENQNRTFLLTNLIKLNAKQNQTKISLTNQSIYIFYDQFLVKSTYELDESSRKVFYYLLMPLITCFLLVLTLTSIKIHSKYYFNKNDYTIFHIESIKEKKMKFMQKAIETLSNGKILIQDHLEIEEKIGEGCFGYVYKGRYQNDDGSIQNVAIKTLKNYCISVNSNEFIDTSQSQINEALIMANFNHKNVMKLIGVYLVEDQFPKIIMPFMSRGNLLDHIGNNRNYLTVLNLFNYAIDIAQGMKYLHSLSFVHRDLAARNCMLDDNNNVVLNDFGLSRCIYLQNYYTSHKKDALPIRWMSIEMIEKGITTMESDVWSYAVTLWELLTRGSQPYSTNQLENYEILDYLKEGNRLLRPETCPVEIYELMLDCFETEIMFRPMFDEILDRITKFVEDNRSKLDVYAKYFVSFLEYPIEDYYSRSEIRKIDDQTRKLLTKLPFYRYNSSKSGKILIESEDSIEMPEI